MYQKHENNIAQVWNEARKQNYAREMEESIHEEETRRLLRDHSEMAFSVTEELEATAEPIINEENVQRCVKDMKCKTAAGPDDLKPEMFKALLKTRRGLKILTHCLKEEAEDQKNS